MGACLCSIFETREERLVEEDGRILYRLICNICGNVLDTREECEHVGPLVSKRGKDAEEEAQAF